MDLVLGTHTTGSWTVVSVEGELDLSTSPVFNEYIVQRLNEGSFRLAFDMTRVPFMDSSTLGVLVTCLKRAREKGGDVVLVGLDGSPLKVLTLTGLDQVLVPIPSLADLPS
jgi:anti-sigma B factor antagonist